MFWRCTFRLGGCNIDGPVVDPVRDLLEETHIAVTCGHVEKRWLIALFTQWHQYLGDGALLAPRGAGRATAHASHAASSAMLWA